VAIVVNLDNWSTPNWNYFVKPEYIDLGKRVCSAVKAAFEDLMKTSQKLFEQIQKHVIGSSIESFVTKINTPCHDIERAFNILGCFPLVGWISGSCRAILGKAQAVCGIGIVAISQIGVFLNSQTHSEKILVGKWKALSDFGMEQLIHGCLNTIRGTGEALIGNYTFGLGNIPLLIPNLINDQNFDPYYAYKK